MAAANEQSAYPQRLGEVCFDACRICTADVLQMQGWTREHFQASAQDTTRGTYTCLVLVIAFCGRVTTHADIDTVRLVAAVGVVEQDEINVRATALACLEFTRCLVGERQPLDVPRRQPF